MCSILENIVRVSFKYLFKYCLLKLRSVDPQRLGIVQRMEEDTWIYLGGRNRIGLMDGLGDSGMGTGESYRAGEGR